ncbi:MAG: ATP-binding protein [candidate division Zixibacteria bacterium]|nr:ATP-binding protein [candidate division Zixibacteria bacterium]
MTLRSDLLNFVYEDYERDNVDFKRSIQWDESTKYELIKDIIAFANRGGGYIVVGYDESQSTSVSRRTGMLEEHLHSWEVTSVAQSLNQFASPSINVEIVKVEDATEQRLYIVIKIPSHGAMPHLCVKDKHDSKSRPVLRRAALYFRNKNKSCEEISDPIDYNELIRRCVLADSHKLMSHFAEVLGSARDLSHSSMPAVSDHGTELDKLYQEAEGLGCPIETNSVYLECACSRVNGDMPVDIEQCKKALAGACWDYNGWPFLFFLGHHKKEVSPQYGDACIFGVHDSTFVRRHFDYWKFDYGRGVFAGVNLTRESSTLPNKEFVPSWQVKFLAEVVISQGRLFVALDPDSSQRLRLTVRVKPANGLCVVTRDDYGNRVRQLSNQYVGTVVISVLEGLATSFVNFAAEFAATCVADIMRKLGVTDPINEKWLIQEAQKRLETGEKV